MSFCTTETVSGSIGGHPGIRPRLFAAAMPSRVPAVRSNVIGVAAGEAPFVLDGLAGNAAEFDPFVHHVGTGGVVPGPDCSLTDCSLNVILGTNLPMTPRASRTDVGTRRREAICVSQKRCVRFRDRLQ